MAVRALQPWKARSPIDVTQEGMSYFSMPTPARISLLLPLSSNTLFSAQYWGFDLSTVMVVRALHRLKAEYPIDVTEDGMFMAVRALQPWKALSPIL